jgi:hypothetical protein
MGVGKTKIRHSAHPNEHQGRSKGWPFYLKAKLNQRRKTMIYSLVALTET